MIYAPIFLYTDPDMTIGELRIQRIREYLDPQHFVPLPLLLEEADSISEF